MTNLPIFRAKKLDSDEFIEGFYLDTAELLGKTLKNKNGYISRDGQWAVIDKSTLSIHFPNILDSQGNKIFASLQEDGKGGDITDKGICMYIFKYHQFRIITNIETMNWLEITRKDLDNYSLKIIGIKQ